MKVKLLPVLILAFLLSACAPTVITPSPGDIATAIAQTEAALPADTDTPPPPTETLPPESTATTIPTVTPTSSGPMDAVINAAFLNMRAGPGTLFDVVETYVEGTPVRARGRVAENDWVEVVVSDEAGETQIGWMSTQYLEFEQDMRGLPLITFPEALMVRGAVETAEGVPIAGVNIAIIYRYEAGELRQDVYTNNQGQFLAYLPEDLLGTLDIQIVGVLCESPIMDENCQQTDYFRLEGRAFINIPQDLPILFRYQEATVNLEGSVLDQYNDPVADIIVVALRDDGAEAYVRSDAEGQFSLPLDAGLWEIYAVTFDPREEGEHVNIEITDQAPDPIEIPAP